MHARGPDHLYLTLHGFDRTMTAADNHAHALAIDRVEIDPRIFKRQPRCGVRVLRRFIKPPRIVLTQIRQRIETG